MPTHRVLSAALIAIVPLFSACKKSEDKKPEPAPPPAAAPVAAPAPAPAPAPDLKVTVKTSSAEDSGDYDGAHALYLASGEDRYIAIPKGCPTFSCDMLASGGMASDKLRKDCAHARWFRLHISAYGGHEGAPKPGPMKSDMEIAMDGATNALAGGDWTDGLTVTEAAADHVNGTIDVKTPNQAHGAFTAKLCPGS